MSVKRSIWRLIFILFSTTALLYSFDKIGELVDHCLIACKLCQPTMHEMSLTIYFTDFKSSYKKRNLVQSITVYHFSSCFCSNEDKTAEEVIQ